MNITIIGSGNVTTVLGRLFVNKGHIINEIAGRNKTMISQLATTLQATPCYNLQQLNTKSDVYMIAVKDDAVTAVATQLKIKQKIVLHTCGSISINVLKGTSEKYGVLYPLQSLRKELHYEPVIPFLIDGNNDAAKNIIKQLASSVSNNIMQATDDVRLQYHLSAVIVSNFTNHLFALTKDYCDKQHINFKLLLPLIEETVNRMHHYDPATMQTGPAARGDKQTIEKHLSLLKNEPALKNIYALMTESIQNNKHAE